jgi:hypothetical protein
MNMEPQNLTPDIRDINRHLAALFPHSLVHPHSESWIEIAYGHPNIREGAVDQAQNFSAFKLEDAAKFAAAKNRDGFNIYVAPALRHGKQPRSGRAKVEHVFDSAFAWIEFDRAGDDERVRELIDRFNLRPALIVGTGTIPHQRAHVYFNIGGIKDAAQLTLINESLQRFFGSDTVKNADRVLRLAGTVNFPNADKQKRGYVVERVTLLKPEGALYSAGELIALSGNITKVRSASTSVSNLNHFERTGNQLDPASEKRLDDDQIGELLQGHHGGASDNWHDDLRAVTWELLQRGHEPSFIRLFVGPYCKRGVDDRDIGPLIDKAWKDMQEERAALERAEQAAKPKQSTRKHTLYGQFGTQSNKRPILKGFLNKGEISSTIGAPKSGKSAVITEIAVHCAAGKDWHGHRSKEKCGVVIFALERADLYRRRLDAYQLAGWGANLPIDVIGGILDLLSKNCVKEIVADVREAEQLMGCSVGLIVIDTFSKALSSGDEDKAKDQNRAAANLRRVLEELDVHIACVGHTGKDQSRGERGSNARLGDIDALVGITGDGKIKTIAVLAANDQPERVIGQFKIEMVELDIDEDGDLKTVSIISAEAVDGEVPGTGRGGLNRSQRLALELLTRAINDQGRPPPNTNEFPHNISVVRLDEWQAVCERGGLSSAEKRDDRDRAFRRAKDTLLADHRIGIWDGWVWLAYT